MVSPRTAEHHVAAVLAKLGTATPGRRPARGSSSGCSSPPEPGGKPTAGRRSAPLVRGSRQDDGVAMTSRRLARGLSICGAVLLGAMLPAVASAKDYPVPPGSGQAFATAWRRRRRTRPDRILLGAGYDTAPDPNGFNYSSLSDPVEIAGSGAGGARRHHRQRAERGLPDAVARAAARTARSTTSGSSCRSVSHRASRSSANHTAAAEFEKSHEGPGSQLQADPL